MIIAREILRHVAAALLDRDRPLGDVLDENRRRAVGDERRLAGQHLIAEDAERIQIAAAVDRALARGLLGRHVRRRADRDARRREPRVALADRARDTEVGHHRAAALRVDQDVVGLDVAVDDAALVGVGERVGHVAQRAARLVDRQRAVVVQRAWRGCRP